jgi:hypothetical protein
VPWYLPEFVNRRAGARVFPNHALDTQQGVHVTVGVDDNGTLQAYVRNVSRAAAGAAVRAYDGKLADRVGWHQPRSAVPG